MVAIQLGNVKNGERFAYVDEFKGTVLISFREFFNADDGSVRPGSKGTFKPQNLTFMCALISLNSDLLYCYYQVSPSVSLNSLLFAPIGTNFALLSILSLAASKLSLPSNFLRNL